MPLIDTPMDESSPELVAKLRDRFLTTSSGVIIDRGASDELVWCCPLAAFEKWYTEIESILNVTLGRRLAYASAESEERRWNHAPALPKSWFKQQTKRIAMINKDWDLRGLGQLDILESNDKSFTLIVANRAHSAVSAGIANATWERISEKRYRFQWSDRGAGETLVEVSEDLRTIPSPTDIPILWKDVSSEPMRSEAFFDMARHESDGVWTVEGNRGLILYRDHILRFENLSIPYLSECSRSSDLQTEWIGIEDDDKMVLWDAMADASRLQLLASGDLVLVAEPENWIGVSKQYLSKQGLGVVSNAESLDEHGGVRLVLPALFHPAITTGRLLGCWERSEGRQGRAIWKSTETGHEIELRSKRVISE